MVEGCVKLALQQEKAGKLVQEDKLTHDERLRLEALNQAVQTIHPNHPFVLRAGEFVMTAHVFEQYLRNGEEEEGK